MTAESPIAEIASLIADYGGEDLCECMQCGTCTAVCPWPTVRQTSPRMVIRLASLGLSGYEEEDVWACVGCGTCLDACPRGVDVTEVMRAARSLLIESGSAPRAYGGPLGSLRAAGNPWSGERADRDRWGAEVGAPTFDASHELLVFPCCTQIYEPHGRRTASALVSLLTRAGISFGVPGVDAACCGELAHSAGAESVFVELRETNERMIDEAAPRRMAVSSPHCLRALRADGTARRNLDVLHHSQLLSALLDEGRLRPERPVDGPVTYHDPCYLGRRGGEYEAPRRVLSAIPGLELREMPRHRETSLCCGGGGGGLWADVPTDQRFAVERVTEARAVGARVLATACPICAVMFDDAVKVLELEEELVVADVAELLAASTKVDR